MKNFKKLVSVTLAVVLILSFTSCSAKQNIATDKSTDKSIETVDTAGEKKVVKFWHIFGGDSDPNKAVLDDVIARAEVEFNVTIEVDTAENDAYKTKLKAAIAANEAPDIFYTWGYGFIKPFVEAEKVIPLNDYLTDDYKSHLTDTTLDPFTTNENIYALTTDQSVAGLFCNTELFEKHNLELPKTYDEFLNVIKEFRAAGVDPISIGGKETWTIALLHDYFALRAVGHDTVMSATSKEINYDDPGFLKAAQSLQELVDLGAFPDGSAGISREESEVPFLQGEIPMYVNGSWTATRIYADSSMVKDKIKFIPFPTYPDGKSTVTDFTGGPNTGFAVSSNAADPKLSAEVAQFVSYESAIGRYEIGSTIPAYINITADESRINPLFMDIYNQSKTATSYTIWWDSLLEGKDSTVYLNKLQELFVGQITPEEYIAELKKLNT